MERDIIQEWFLKKKIDLDIGKADKLRMFAEMIHDANRKFNITGFKTQEEILSELILKSIEPLSDIIVPRGTRVVDLGSGAGIPGIPLFIYNENLSGVLVESNNKKSGFERKAIASLGLRDISVVSARAEDAAKDVAFREKFDFCLARAFNKLYITIELGAPLIKKGGYLFVYSNDSIEDIPEKIKVHAAKLGLQIMSHNEYDKIKISGPGIFFKKESLTPVKFPRRFSAIKREAQNI